MAKLVLRTMKHYLPSVEHAANKFDALEILPMVGANLVESVTHHYMDNVHQGFMKVPGGVLVNVYRTHGWARPAGFPFAFAEAVGVPPAEYTVPGWDDGTVRTPRIALAFATMNVHGSDRRRIAFTPPEWTRLAEALRAAGLICLATGHADDGRPGDMPGWEWINCELREALALLLRSDFIVGGNSGMAFLGSTIGSAKVVMIDEAAHGHLALYDTVLLARAVDITRFHKIRTRTSGEDDRMAFEQTIAVAKTVSIR